MQSRRTTTVDNGIDTARGRALWHLFLTIALVIIVESLTLPPLIYSDLRVQITSLIELIVSLMTESIKYYNGCVRTRFYL